MSSRYKRAEVGKFRNIQILTAIFSFIFFTLIAFGYYNLLLEQGWFLSFLFGLVMAGVAWFLARVTGTTGGVRKNPLLFLFLLIVSAAGIYNTLMLQLEGEAIVIDTIENSFDDFSAMENAAERARADAGTQARINEIEKVAEALFSEIRNPLNCGQGPEARRLIARLQNLLPGFIPLSAAGVDCSRNQEVIDDYRAKINQLIDTATWNNPVLRGVKGNAAEAKQRLITLSSEVSASYSPRILPRVKNDFNALNSIYREERTRLSSETSVEGLASALPTQQVEALGNAFKLPGLFAARLDQWSTYAYLAAAVLFDYLMVHLFMRAQVSVVRPSKSKSKLMGAI